MSALIGSRGRSPRALFCCFAALLRRCCRRTLFVMSAPITHRYLGVQGRGTIALPADVRRRLHLDEPGAQLEMTERADGVIELRAALPIPADQRWFWAERWQEREREVDEHVAAGRVRVHESTEDFLDHLDHLDELAGE